jgi:hypothetical protein
MKQNPTPGICDNLIPEQPPTPSGQQAPSGRRRSKLNAVKAGIFASVLLTAPPFHESKKNYEKLKSTLEGSIQPRDSFEQFLLDNLAFQFLRLTRVYKAEAEIMPLMFEKMREVVDREPYERAAISIEKGERIPRDRILAPDLILRYDTTIWRQCDRILDQLERWRRIKGWSPGS